MLDQNDLQAIAQLMNAMEERMDAKMDAKMEAQEHRIINQVNAIIETTVVPQIRLIAEQHGDIIARLDEINGIDDIKDRVRVLERVVETHTNEIEALKIAQ